MSTAPTATPPVTATPIPTTSTAPNPSDPIPSTGEKRKLVESEDVALPPAESTKSTSNDKPISKGKPMSKGKPASKTDGTIAVSLLFLSEFSDATADAGKQAIKEKVEVAPKEKKPAAKKQKKEVPQRERSTRTTRSSAKASA